MQSSTSVRHLLLTAILVVLLGTLATLQYRWLGDVSAAERERLRASVRARATDFTTDFDRAITSLFTGFRVDAESADRDPAGALLAAYNRAAASSPVAPSLIARVYLFDGTANGQDELRLLDVDRGRLEPVAWPAELESWHRVTDLMPSMPQPAGKPFPMFFANSLDPKTPAIIVGIPRVAPIDPATPPGAAWNPRTLVRAAIVRLDKEALKTRLIEPLVAKHFGSGASAEYFVTVVRSDHPSDVVYTSSSDPVNEKTADVSAPFFALRADEANNVDFSYTRLPTPQKDRVAIAIVRRGDGSDPVRMITHRQDGAWDLLIRCRAGSLEAVVAQSRRRNIGIGLGVLALLGASFVLVVMSAQRQQRLARQQMEFVAAVSHELRTPLAVICSAGENLADGVVAEREQVKQYGALVQTEGRRLADMVERVMEFAGMSAGGSRRPPSDVDLAALVAQVTAAVGFEARRRNIDVRVRTDSALPRVVGDPDGLRSALQNIVGNAVKYSPDGEAVEVAVEANGSGVRVRVADRGIGIDADELPRVFEPFFRGRRAIDRQLRGTGVGLSVVRQVVDAHGGDVRIESGADEGTTVTVFLPAGPDGPPATAAEVSHAS